MALRAVLASGRRMHSIKTQVSAGADSAAASGEKKKKKSVRTEGEEEMVGIQQFAAEQNVLPPRNPDLPGSGAQQEARRLYRELLRESNRKLDPEVRNRLQRYIKHEFRTHQDVPKMQFMRIEWLLRKGRQQLEVLQGTDQLDGFNVYVPEG